MKVAQRIFFTSLLIALLGLIALLIYMTSQKPHYSGSVQVKGINSQVEVIYDYYGIPHIYATNELDAYFALGYVHAQDRLFQMEMVRRVASGTLSEIFGSKFIKIDAFFKTLGFEEHAAESAKMYMSADSLPYQRAALAYLKGVNQYQQNGRTPVEFILLGIPCKDFTVEDMFLATDYMAFNFAMAFRTDPLMTFVKSKLGDAYYKDLVTNHKQGTMVNPVYTFPDTAAAHQTAFNTIDQIIQMMPVPPLVGSNGWVISGQKSKSGKVLFANDTHIGFSQPCVWYEAHLEYPGFSFYGNHLAGFPFAAIGHTRTQGWGLTMFENDDLDFYSEKIKPGDSSSVWSNGNWQKLEIKKKVIHVKDSLDYPLTVRVSRHGPLIQDVMPEWKAITTQNVAASWTHLKFPSNLMQVTYGLSHSKSFDETRAAVSQLISPGLNVLYGDNSGNIAWWAAAKLVKRKSTVDPVLLQNGIGDSSIENEYFTFEENPKSENPPNGYVLSANNQPDTMPGQSFYPGYYVPDDRAKRISILLNEREKYSTEDMERMNQDALSPSAPLVARAIMDGVDKETSIKTKSHRTATKKLLVWDGDHQLHDIGPVIYYRLLYKVLAGAMIDEMGEENFKVFLGTHVMKNSLLSFMNNHNSVWWDDVNTRDVKETRTMIFNKAFDETIKSLTEQLGQDPTTWEWGRVHLLEHVHPVGMKKPFNMLFNVGPFAVPGGQEVINQIAFDLTPDKVYKSTYGPAMRIIIDFADVENSLSILPTGQSGNVMSHFYNDQAYNYNNGINRTQKMNRVAIVNNKSHRLLLQPEHIK
jgi:penicillin amidase